MCQVRSSRDTACWSPGPFPFLLHDDSKTLLAKREENKGSIQHEDILRTNLRVILLNTVLTLKKGLSHLSDFSANINGVETFL